MQTSTATEDMPGQASETSAPAALLDDSSIYDWRRGLALGLVSIIIGLTQSLGIFLVNNNLSSVQGELGATVAEAGWLTTAYFATALSATVLLTKMRLQYGLRRFAEWAIVAYLIVVAVHLVAQDLSTAIAVRAAMGLAASPLTTLALLYMLEAVPKPFALVGVTLGFATLQFGAPLSRIVSESLLQADSWRGLLMLDVALAFASLAGITAVKLTPPPLQKVLNRGDVVSFVLYGAALAMLCIFFSQGRVNWWTDTAWLGLCLAGGVACLGLYVAVELQRKNPLLDLRWIFRIPLLRLLFTMLLFRIVLSEQPVGAVTMMNSLGFNNDQMQVMFMWVTFGTAVGFGLSLFALPTMSLRAPALVALVLIFIAALMDSSSTSLTRPDDLYLSQTLLAAGTSMFLMSSLLVGFVPVIQDGLKNVVSFFAVFSATQMMGSLIGSAWFSTYLADQQRLHFANLVQSFLLQDPIVVARLQQGSATFGGVITDAVERNTQSLAILAQQASREAFVLAYNDLFHLIAILAAITFVWLSSVTFHLHRQRVKAAETSL